MTTRTDTDDPTTLHLRPIERATLADVRKAIDVKTESTVVDLANVKFKLTSKDPSIVFDGREVPATDIALRGFGTLADVPSKFFERIGSEVQEFLLNKLLVEQGGGEVVIGWNDGGIHDVRPPNQRVIDSRALVDVASSVLGRDANVVEWYRTAAEFRLDVLAPEAKTEWIGGDKPSARSRSKTAKPKVGDMTRSGLRIFHDTKHNLVPSIDGYFFRLVCTNGMETQEIDKVDARGLSVEQVLGELEALAQRVMDRAPERMKHFYDLRNEVVEEPEQHLMRLMDEQGLPERTQNALVRRIPAVREEGGTVSMFDLVNLITNQANDPHTLNKPRYRRNLESVGGRIVTEHVARCRSCRSRLN